VRRQTFFRLFLSLTLAIGVLVLRPPSANAQARGGGHVAVGVGGGRVAVGGGYYGGHVVVGGRYGYYPYYGYRPYYYGYYPHFYFGLGFGYPYYYPWYYGYPYPYYGFGYPYPAAYGYGYSDPTASVRLEIVPKTTEVYVDGYPAGTVDDYDGFFQRLRVPPGSHEIVLYHDGYRTVHQQLNLSTGSDQKIQYSMVALQPGEQAEPRPNPPPPREPTNQNEPQYPPAYQQPDVRRVPSQAPPHAPAPAPMPAEPNAGEEARYGSVSIRVQPIDAQVLIDGDEWSSSRPEERLVVELPQGRHHVEIQKDGFQKYSNDIQIRSGETVSLNVSLLKR
jgi:hypothetical protein